MFIMKMSLPRRTFLKGMGTTLALPLLEAMVPAFTATAQTVANPARRFGAVYMPQGMIMTEWTPETEGAGFEIKRLLKPLEPFRDQLVVVSGLDGAPNGNNGTHATGPASFLSGVSPRPTEGTNIYNGVTLDQVIAKQIGQSTVFPSLEVATEDFSGWVGACETGYSCQYMNTLSWTGPTSPQPMEINPRVLFERMFGGTGTPEERAVRRADDRSILDEIQQHTVRLGRTLGPRDRVRLDQYLDNVREIERRIQRAEQENKLNASALPSAPLGVPEDFAQHVGLLFDLLAVAFETDMTRVFTFMLARELHGRAYPELGAWEGHHRLSHHRYAPDKMAMFAAVNLYHIQQFARFVKKLRDTPDGDGSLLDHSMLMLGSGMSWGTTHSHVSLPLAVVGGGSGNVRGNRHLVYPKDSSHGNLLLALAQKTGVEMERFGLSTQAVDL